MNLRNLFAAMVMVAFTQVASAGTAVLDITFDDFPNETAFGMWDSDSAPTIEDLLSDPALVFDGVAYDVGASSPIGFGDGFVLPGDFAGQPPGPFQFVWNLAPGTYAFVITDSFGDGICCGFGQGSFSLSVDGNVVVAGGAFADFAAADFNVTTPIPLPAALVLFVTAVLSFGGLRRR